MGWCQGRVCGFATAVLATSGAKPLAESDLRPVAKRPICAPVRLGDLAATAADFADEPPDAER
jgi:D-hydroxyproline dehydrogenase subunit alpha